MNRYDGAVGTQTLPSAFKSDEARIRHDRAMVSESAPVALLTRIVMINEKLTLACRRVDELVGLVPEKQRESMETASLLDKVAAGLVVAEGQATYLVVRLAEVIKLVGGDVSA